MPDTSLVDVVRQQKGYDIVIRGGNVVNVFTGEIVPAEIGIYDGQFGEIRTVGGSGQHLEGATVVDVDGAYVTPGLIDSHLHIESSMMTPVHFAQAVLPCGTTCVAVDPHEIANVLGIEGVRYMVETSRSIPLSVYVQVPSCVPAVPDKETAGAVFSVKEISEMLDWDDTIALAEVMDYPGVINGESRMRSILAAARSKGVIICGHCPMLTGSGLAAYLAAGPRSDHEFVAGDEVLEKLRAGMFIEARVSSHSQNVSVLAGVLEKLGHLPPNVVLCTDDVLPNDVVGRGHMDFAIRKAISAGITPVDAVRMATINAANRYRLWDRGAVAPGRRADLCIVPDLNDFRVDAVYVKGRKVAEAGRLVVDIPVQMHPVESRNTVTLPPGRDSDVLIPPTPVTDGTVMANVMRVNNQSLLVEWEKRQLLIADGKPQLGPEMDLALVAVIERHTGTGNVGFGLVSGLGLAEGAVATTVAHDSHNLLVAGYDMEEMWAAVLALKESGGGVVYVRQGQVAGMVELPVAGLLSLLPAGELAPKLEDLQQRLKNAGIAYDDPLMAFLILALPVIPRLRLTDKGLVDVDKQEMVPLFNEESMG